MTEGLAVVRSGIRNWTFGVGRSTFSFTRLALHPHRLFISNQQARAEMVPSEIVDNPAPGRLTHPFHLFRMPIELEDRGRKIADVSRLNDNAFDPIVYDIAGFTSRDLRQAASRRLVNDLGASLALGRENVDGPLAEVIFNVALEADDPDVVTPVLFQVRFNFVVNSPHEPQFRVLQVEPVPCLQQMMHALAFN